MCPILAEALAREMAAARNHYAVGNWSTAFAHLERAHILGQRYAFAHLWTHLWMLRVGWARRDLREILGQLPRMLAAILFSRIWVPIGNTGGANVSALKPMPIPQDLAAILREHQRPAFG